MQIKEEEKEAPVTDKKVKKGVDFRLSRIKSMMSKTEKKEKPKGMSFLGVT